MRPYTHVYLYGGGVRRRKKWGSNTWGKDSPCKQHPEKRPEIQTVRLRGARGCNALVFHPDRGPDSAPDTTASSLVAPVDGQKARLTPEGVSE